MTSDKYPRFWQLIGNITLLSFIILGPFFIESKLTDEVYALIFILIPITPLFLAVTFGKKYKEMSSPYETTSLGHIFKYISYIYLFSITSIIMTKIPYINYSEFVDKYSLAQYTLSISLSNFIVIPLNLLTLKILSSEMKKKINIGLVNLFLIIFISLSALALFYISSSFTLLNQLTNISSTSILTSTYVIIGITAISSINLSVSLREQKKIRYFVLLDVILIFVLFFITRYSTLLFESLSSYNYLIAGSIFLKVLFQIYLLRERNVYNNNCKL